MRTLPSAIMKSMPSRDDERDTALAAEAPIRAVHDWPVHQGSPVLTCLD